MNHEQHTDRLLDQSEMAQILAIKSKTPEYWRLKGMGPKWVRIGKLIRYRESDIRTYLEQLDSIDEPIMSE